MPKRPCLDCGHLTQGSRCPTHQAQHERKRDQRRGTTAQRGYGTPHQHTAAHLHATHVDGTPCRRCGEPMHSWQELDAGHSDDQRAHTGALPDALEHSSCNRGRRQHTPRITIR